ncbi:AAA family ATPase [Candidatus Woesearchaeota archaeon]|nr:AAA family ATPase [Candidatus Woesearchaeota archaeon]
MPTRLTFANVLKSTIYNKRKVLYDLKPPSGFVHRTEQRNELIVELSPILLNSAVQGIFVYGTPGTGKTGLILELLDEIKKEAKKNKVNLNTHYLNCSENRTETTILMELLMNLNPSKNYPKMGWTRKKAVSEFENVLDDIGGNILFALDEVDYALRESGDDILYRLSRINDKIKANVSTIIISNDIKVMDYIKPRTQSTFGRVKVIFSPYAAEELFDILKQRVEYAFKPEVVSEAVIKKIGELEAERGGDARKALELLDSCAKNALSKGRDKITLDLVEEADKNLEQDSTVKILSSLAKHHKVLYLALLKGKKETMSSKEVYKHYLKECGAYDTEPLTERRIRSFLVELGELGLIETEVGWLKDLKKKSRKITLNLDPAIKNKVRKLLRDSI